MQNTPIKLFDTLVIGFSNLTDDAVYALEQNFGAHHYDRLNVVVRTAQGSWITDKARVTKAYQDLSVIIDSVGLCIFFAVRNLASKDLGVASVGILEYLNAAISAGYTLEELKHAGERIINAERMFFVNAGFTAKDDSLPRRLTEEPSPTGPAKGMVCHLPEMLEEYYQVRGWTEDGLPGMDLKYVFWKLVPETL